MFVQVLTGKVKDASAVQQRLDVWMRDLKPGAKGWLGSTGGVAADGTFVAVVRFESQAAADANAARPEQGAWWTETEKVYDGAVTFYNCPTVETLLGGGSDDAGFVQVMIGKPSDAKRVIELNRELEQYAKDRPDLLGNLIALATDGTMIETAYFTSEAAAREGEKRDVPAEVSKLFEEWRGLIPDLRFVDIPSPMLHSA